MEFSIDNKIYFFDETLTLRFEGRDIILIHSEDGWKQGFYRSSGRNSGKAGRWFPFDGYKKNIHWFDKSRFCLYGQKYTEMERYGFPVLKQIGDALGNLQIQEGKETCGDEVNSFVWLSDEDVQKQPYCPFWLKLSRKEANSLGDYE